MLKHKNCTPFFVGGFDIFYMHLQFIIIYSNIGVTKTEDFIYYNNEVRVNLILKLKSKTTKFKQ